jgi:hypothetical protein
VNGFDDPLGYMTTPQKFAAATTFGKRYTYLNRFGIATDDEVGAQNAQT